MLLHKRLTKIMSSDEIVKDHPHDTDLSLSLCHAILRDNRVARSAGKRVEKEPDVVPSKRNQCGNLGKVQKKQKKKLRLY